MQVCRSFFLGFLIAFLSSILSFSPSWAERISFDLDETLISSANLTNEDIAKAKELGYKVLDSEEGRQYIVRPGAEEVLKYADEQGFEVFIITLNLYEYADDILYSSGLFKYVDEIIANDELLKPYNQDFKKYPRHRNNLIEQKSFVERWTTGFYRAYITRAWLNATGNKNIQPYVPKKYLEKYPPVYGSRLHFDNSSRHVNEPLDYIGIKVKPFYGISKSIQDDKGKYVWAQSTIETIDSFKEKGWEDLYSEIYGKQPNNEAVEPVL